jgi:hypothetical protein
LGDCLFWAIFLTTEEAQIFGLLVSTEKKLCIKFDKKLVGQGFGQDFSHTHLVTLSTILFPVNPVGSAAAPSGNFFYILNRIFSVRGAFKFGRRLRRQKSLNLSHWLRGKKCATICRIQKHFSEADTILADTIFTTFKLYLQITKTLLGGRYYKTIKHSNTSPSLCMHNFVPFFLSKN